MLESTVLFCGSSQGLIFLLLKTDHVNDRRMTQWKSESRLGLDLFCIGPCRKVRRRRFHHPTDFHGTSLGIFFSWGWECWEKQHCDIDKKVRTGIIYCLLKANKTGDNLLLLDYHHLEIYKKNIPRHIFFLSRM